MTHTRLMRLVLLAAMLVSVAGALPTARAQDGVIVYDSTPDAVALYLGDMAYVRDLLTIPAGVTARIALPPTALRDSLVLTADGSRVPNYRLSMSDTGQTVVTVETLASGGPVEFAVAYLASGAGWSPRYDMVVLNPENVALGFAAEIHNHALNLEDVDLRLVAGMAGADPNYRPDMTVTQMNVLYNEPEQPMSAGGPVNINHVYPVGTQSILPGETLVWTLLDDELSARRLIVWDARFGQRTDVIYKVRNSSETPFVEGSVQTYEDGLFVGQDAIEWTPPGSEGSVTIGGLSSIRVRRTESVEQVGTFNNDRYRHDVILAISNHAEEDITLTVLDEWNRSGENFEFSDEPTRQGNNVLRWEPTIPAGETIEITYTFIVD